MFKSLVPQTNVFYITIKRFKMFQINKHGIQKQLFFTHSKPELTLFDKRYDRKKNYKYILFYVDGNLWVFFSANVLSSA